VQYAIVPRESSLFTIITGPVIHGDWNHFVSNFQVLLPLIAALVLFYHERAALIYSILFIVSGLLLWYFGEYGAHIGMSGVIIALAFYLFFSGIFSLEWPKLTVSLVIGVLYCFALTSFYLAEEGISVDSHICGFFTGFLCVLVQHYPQKRIRFT